MNRFFIAVFLMLGVSGMSRASELTTYLEMLQQLQPMDPTQYGTLNQIVSEADSMGVTSDHVHLVMNDPYLAELIHSKMAAYKGLNDKEQHRYVSRDIALQVYQDTGNVKYAQQISLAIGMMKEVKDYMDYGKPDITDWQADKQGVDEAVQIIRGNQ